ncbi:hypothetical protein BHE74_00038157, partial [Ensete ventricosum]
AEDIELDIYTQGMAHGAATGVLPIPLCPAAKQSSSGHLHGRADPLLHLREASRAGRREPKRWPLVTTRASASTVKESVLRDFRQRRALKIISGLQNFDKDKVASVVIAAEKVCICVSSVDPIEFLPAVEAGAQMVRIINLETKLLQKISSFSSEQVKLAELLEQEGADIIQTEGGKYSSPSKPGVLGLIEKATPTLAAAYSISRAVKIPVMCSSGLSAVTAPMALTAGAAGVGVGSAVNKLNDVVAMIAEVKSIAESLGLLSRCASEELSSARQ